MRRLGRRRFLAISAAACVLPGAVQAAPAIARWRGVALGALASMTLAGVERAAAGDTFAAVEREVARLEDLFSLHRETSALVRLNRTGLLQPPAPDFLALLERADAVYRATGGAFDPTIQPLWLLHAGAAAAGRHPTPQEITATRHRSGWRHLRVSPQSVTFDRPGMAVTLNGIAQGFIADCVAALLRRRGFRDVLVDTGEVVALGSRPDGSPWRAGIALPDGRIVRRLGLRGRALATSAPLGTPLGPGDRSGHILDPRSGTAAARWRLVSVAASSAALADGLSTAFCLLSRNDIDRALAAHPDASLEALL